ncbi:MAG: type II secretion system protein GspD [Bradymonadales bacterium]|nr:MAG: type II secretion system protein GspD [Bradymonadales bacterium]
MKSVSFLKSPLLLGVLFLVLAPTPSLAQEGFSEINGMFDDEDFEDLEEISDSAPNDVFDEEMPTEVSPIRRPTQITRPAPRARPTQTTRSRQGPSGPRSTLNFAEEVPNPEEKLRMDFIQVDIEEVVKFFSERLKKKFIFDPSILQGQITIVSPTEVSVQEAWQAFLSAMEIRGYAVYPAGAYLKIDRVANARKAPIPLYLHSTPDDDSYVTRIVTLQYLSVRDIRQAVRELVSRGGGDVIEHAPTNTLIITDYASNIRRIVRILNILDVEGFQEQIAVIPLNYTSAAEAARKINEIFPTGPQTGTPQRPTPRTARQRQAAQQAAAAAAGGESVIQKVVSDDRTNSLIVLGSERGIEQVRRFLEQIDIAVEGGDGQIHVYPLQNVKAEDIAQTLANLTQAASPRTPTTQRQTPAQRAAAARAGTPPETAQASADLFDGDIRITADPRSNALIIMASPRDFETIRGIIEKLDVRRRQVFIESVILEARVGGGSQFGSQVTGPLFRTGAMGGQPGQPNTSEKSSAVGGIGALPSTTNLLSILGGLAGGTSLQGLALGFRSGGTVSVPFTTSDGKTETRQVPLLSAVLQLAATSSNINVLSTPHILATANEQASIAIGQEIPQVRSQQPDAQGNLIQTFDRIRIATELSITPQINAGDYLTLEIDQKVNEPGESIQGQISTVTREAKTTAIVQDGQTIVIGGIMRDRTVVDTNKVPFLGDIPILGWLFKSRRTENQKVNLLLFITPHIIRDTGDMNDVFFRKLSERNDFLKRIGVDEMPRIPFSGFRREDLEFLDEEYLKSIQLTPLPDRVPLEEKSPNALQETEVKEAAPKRRKGGSIPIGPRSREALPVDSDFEDAIPVLEMESSDERPRLDRLTDEDLMILDEPPSWETDWNGSFED